MLSAKFTFFGAAFSPVLGGAACVAAAGSAALFHFFLLTTFGKGNGRNASQNYEYGNETQIIRGSDESQLPNRNSKIERGNA